MDTRTRIGMWQYLLSFDEPSIERDYLNYIGRCAYAGREPHRKSRFIALAREWEQHYHATWDRLNAASTLATAGAPHPDWDYIQHLEFELCV